MFEMTWNDKTEDVFIECEDGHIKVYLYTIQFKGVRMYL